MSFDESIKKLEEIVSKLGNSAVSLEESLKLYKEGIELSAKCKKELEEAKLKIEVINAESGE